MLYYVNLDLTSTVYTLALRLYMFTAQIHKVTLVTKLLPGFLYILQTAISY